MGLVDEREVVAAVAEHLDVPMANRHETTPDSSVAALLSESLARGLGAIPISRDPDGTILVAICNPGPKVASELQVALGASSIYTL